MPGNCVQTLSSNVHSLLACLHKILVNLDKSQFSLIILSIDPNISLIKKDLFLFLNLNFLHTDKRF